MAESLDSFLYKKHTYNGQFNPENLVFNANIQEFAYKTNYACSLQTGGKLSSEEAYKQIKASWKKLKRSKKQLNIGQNTSPDEQDT
jgi:hypothetical protein